MYHIMMACKFAHIFFAGNPRPVVIVRTLPSLAKSDDLEVDIFFLTCLGVYNSMLKVMFDLQ